MIPSKDKTKIENIYLINSKKIIDFMKIDIQWANIILKRNNCIKRNLNCQQNMTISDVKEIADFII